MISSYCGIDCSVCDLNISRQCFGCFESEEKRSKCQVPECAAGREVETCFKCTLRENCEKRRNNIGECWVFFSRHISPRRPYLIGDAHRDDAFNLFFRDVYEDADGLIVHFDPIDEKWEYLLKDVKRIEGVYNLDKIQKELTAFIKQNYNPIILIDNLSALKEKNSLPEVLNFLNEISKKAISKSGMVFTINDLEGRDEEKVTKYMAEIMVESMLGAVSNRQRKGILRLLGRRGNASFKEIMDKLDYYVPSKLSFHLELLRDTGILEQDSDGIYSISQMGKEFDGIMDNMAELSASKVHLRPTPDAKLRSVPDEETEDLLRYMRDAKESGNFQFVNLIKDMKKSLGTYYGKDKTDDVLLTTLGHYAKSGKSVDKKGLRRMVSEIVFVHLVSTMKLDKAMNWADEVLEEHDLD